MLGNANWGTITTTITVSITAHIFSPSQGKIGSCQLSCIKNKGFWWQEGSRENNFFLLNWSFRGGSSLSRWDLGALGESLHCAGMDNRKWVQTGPLLSINTHRLNLQLNFCPWVTNAIRTQVKRLEGDRKWNPIEWKRKWKILLFA